MKPAVLAAMACAALVGAAPLQAVHAHEGHETHEHHGDHEAHAAHEHGVATLRVVSADTVLMIEFASPLDNLVGFEHEPRTDEQRKAMADAERLLRDGAGLFRPSAGAECLLLGVKLDSPWPQDGHHEHRHGHDEAHEAGGDDGHADLEAEYRFECATPDRLKVLQTRLFDTFPRLRELRAERATASGQGSAALTPGKADLPL
ncbi:DUF2796 domain-containing protein [Thauera linaloolentis]|nr:DUF2796 domain-containing protein [Thauera linaloolentis]MCM8565632.1 DUF2796 domain-containing protein [Thauera linaloolentis]